MDIDRNFLEEMLIMEEEKDRHLSDNIVYMPHAQDRKTVNLTAAELQLLDRILSVVSGERSVSRSYLSSYDLSLLTRIREKLGPGSKEKVSGN